MAAEAFAPPVSAELRPPSALPEAAQSHHCLTITSDSLVPPQTYRMSHQAVRTPPESLSPDTTNQGIQLTAGTLAPDRSGSSPHTPNGGL